MLKLCKPSAGHTQRMRVQTFHDFIHAFLIILKCNTPLAQEDVLIEGMKHARHDGLWLEFGVWSGNTIHKLAAHHNDTVYGFDSFMGLPSTWRLSKLNPGNGFDRAFTMKNSFSRHGRAPHTRLPTLNLSKACLTRRWRPFMKARPAEECIRLLHMDCDLYLSSSYVLSELGDRIVPGTVMVFFDELINYFPSFEEHEMLSLWEAMRRWKWPI